MDPPTRAVPLKVRTHVMPSADGLARETTRPAPAPLRPTTDAAPASRVTTRSNVTVSELTFDRWALPSLTVTDATAGAVVRLARPGVPPTTSAAQLAGSLP